MEKKGYNFPSPPPSICSISLNMTDRIRLIEVPSKLTAEFRLVVLEGWKKGIQDEREYHRTRTFKLKGNPWLGMGEGAVWSRALIAAVLTFMARKGWSLLSPIDVSKKEADKHTLFFEYDSEPDPDVQIFSISLNMTDRIRVVGATGVMPAVKKAVEAHWKYGIQEERDYFGSPELKLKGNPWHSDGKDTVRARVLLNHILTNVHALGFKLYGSVDHSTGINGGFDLDSLYFRNIGPNWP